MDFMKNNEQNQSQLNLPVKDIRVKDQQSDRDQTLKKMSTNTGLKMFVIKRDGREEIMQFDKITNRILNVTNEVNSNLKKKNNFPEGIDVHQIALETIKNINNRISTVDIDMLSSQICVSKVWDHPNYGILAGSILISSLHKMTKGFYETMKLLYSAKDEEGNNVSIISEEFYEIVKKNAKLIEEQINYDLDYEFDYFGFKTLERSYLFRINGMVVERPQHLFMRVSIGIHGNDLESAFESYRLMSQLYFIHATPTLFNAGTKRPQLSSCFLLAMKDDSIDGIYDTLKQCAQISKHAGGIGLHCHNVRGKNSPIHGTNGTSNGIIPMLKVYNETCRYVDQGGGKRKGSFAIYLEPWHPDVFEFLELKLPVGSETERARDLFFALWIPDKFMRAVKNNEPWYLLCPNRCPGLSDAYGEEFDNLYDSYVKKGAYVKKIMAQELWLKMMVSQIESGSPYVLYKDHINNKNNQKNLGTIKSSNLCTEIVQYTDANETAVCNLASISLRQFVIRNGEKVSFDYHLLQRITAIITKNLNKVIDINYYPTKECRVSNQKHRPIGIGIQGLADLFFEFRYDYDSEEAKQLSTRIMETIQYAAIASSCELAKTDGPYETFQGSPMSKGIFQHNMWGIDDSATTMDWGKLRKEVMQHGVRNSLFTAPMPTVSTSRILNNKEGIDAMTSNMFEIQSLAGNFRTINTYLFNDLKRLNLWNNEMKEMIMYYDGSIQSIPNIPDELKSLYRTVWEIPQKAVIDLAAARGPFVCQSQSMNIYYSQPSFNKLTSMLFYGWEKGLKTGMYYLRTRTLTNAKKFGVSTETIEKIKTNEKNAKSSDEPCLTCGS